MAVWSRVTSLLNISKATINCLCTMEIPSIHDNKHFSLDFWMGSYHLWILCPDQVRTSVAFCFHRLLSTPATLVQLKILKFLFIIYVCVCVSITTNWAPCSVSRCGCSFNVSFDVSNEAGSFTWQTWSTFYIWHHARSWAHNAECDTVLQSSSSSYAYVHMYKFLQDTRKEEGCQTFSCFLPHTSPGSLKGKVSISITI